MKSIFVFLLLILAVPLSIHAQVGGERVYQFLNISSSARQIALGGEALTLMDDINQPIWNPATINGDLDGILSVNYSRYLAGVNMGSISYAREFSRKFGTVHGNIKYLDYGTIIGSDEQGNETGNFKASDIAISIGYAYNFPNTNFYFGANLKVISSNISNFSSTGVATDVALLYHSPFKPFSFTLVARNLGTQIASFRGENERLPFEVALGSSYKLQYVPLKWYVTLGNLQQWDISAENPSDQTTDLEGNVNQEEIGFISNTLRHFVIGAELFPERIINLRI